MIQDDLLSQMSFFQYQNGLRLMKEYFRVRYLSATQVEVKYDIPNIYWGGLSIDFMTNIVGKTFTLDTSVVGFSTMARIGGIVDGYPKRSSNFYSIYASFSVNFQFEGIGLVQCNKTITSTKVDKVGTSQDLTITAGQGNFWGANFVPIEVWKDGTNWILGEAKRKDANTLTVQNCGTYGSGNISAGTVYIYQRTDKVKQVPYNVLNNLISPNWLWMTSCICVDSGGNIENFWFNNLLGAHNVTVKWDSVNVWKTIFQNSGLSITTAYVPLGNYISAAAKSINFLNLLYKLITLSQVILYLRDSEGLDIILGEVFSYITVATHSHNLKSNLIGFYITGTNYEYSVGFDNYQE